MADPPYRELADPIPIFSTYARFWKDGTVWQTFISPPGRIVNPAVDRTHGKPGIYELGLSIHSGNQVIVPVYVGKATNLKSRLAAYAKDGSHIAKFIDEAVANGMTIYQRVRYLSTEPQASRWEATCLIEYDYAWNLELNPPKRTVVLEDRSCGPCLLGADVIHIIDNTPNTTYQSVGFPSKRVRQCNFYTLLTLLFTQIALAITVIAIVAEQLESVIWFNPSQGITTSQCLLGTTGTGRSLCIYAHIVSGLSMVCSFILLMLLLAAPRMCRQNIELVLTVFSAIWWMCAAAVFASYGSKADADGLPQSEWRQTVDILAWIEMALFVLQLMVQGIFSAGARIVKKRQPKKSYNVAQGGASTNGASPLVYTTPPQQHSPYSVSPMQQAMSQQQQNQRQQQHTVVNLVSSSCDSPASVGLPTAPPLDWSYEIADEPPSNHQRRL